MVRVTKARTSQPMMAPGVMWEAGAACEMLESTGFTGYLSGVKGLAHLGVLAINNPIPNCGHARPMRFEFFEQNGTVYVWCSTPRIKLVADSEYRGCVRWSLP